MSPEYLSRYGSSVLAGLSATWIPVGSGFSAPVQTGTEAHPDSYTIGIGPFPGGKTVGRGVEHPAVSSSEVKERVELYLYSPFGPSWLVIGCNLPLGFRLILKERQWFFFLNSVNRLNILMEMKWVVFEVGAAVLFVIDTNGILCCCNV